MTPSAYRSQGAQQSTRRQETSTARTKQAAAAPSGAVRRSEGARAPTRTHHIGKLTAVAVVVAGAVVWTTGSSKTFTPTSDGSQLTRKSVKTASMPLFFFDDNADALERTHNTVEAEGLLPTSFSTSDNNIATTNSEVPGTPGMLKTVNIGHQNALSDALYRQDMPADSIYTPDYAGDNDSTGSQPDGMQQVTVAQGDTLSGILNRHGLKVDQMRPLLGNQLVREYLSNIDIGQVLELTSDDNGEFTNLSVKVGNDRRVNIARTESGFDVTTIELPLETRRVVTSGKINQSLYLAAAQANLKQSTIMELANIFQWELDFARDIRKGDRFSIVYDRLYREGEYIGDGDILAAEFIRGGKSYKAIRFTTDDGSTGYYSPEGKSKRRTFLRHPVDVVRITSKFNPNRLHPVLHQIRAHRGVDYGSPHGSPIYATADGKVSYSGSKSAYGNTVILKHGEQFSTLYAHMSRISDKSQVGKRVKQGDVIGYVGNTGRVTGTHLHYEFRVDNTQIDPLKVELPAAQPIDSKYREGLKTLADEMSMLMADTLQSDDKQVATAPIDLDSL